MASIRYDFVSSGVSGVKDAFKGIEESAKSAERATRSRAATSSKALSAEEKRYQTVQKYAAQVEKDLAKEAAAAEKAAKRGADAQVKEAARGAKAHAAALAHVAGIRERYAAQQARDAAKAATTEIREAKRSASEQAKAREFVFQVKQRYLQAEAKAQKASRDETRATDMRLAKGFVFGAAGFVGAGLGIAGGAAREGMKLQEASNRLSISARDAGGKGADPIALRKEFEAAALANPGIKAMDIAEGAQSFVAKTGDLESARKFSGTFATVASATGSSVQDIAGAAADISQKFDIKGIEEMQAALAALTFQGKKGAFELKDAASQFAKISAAAERFGIAKGSEGLKTLGGLTQIARTATGSPEQAATAVEAMFRQLVVKSKDLTAIGASPFVKGSTTKTRNVQDVIVDAISKSKGSLPALQNIFGDEGIRGVSPLISRFNQAKDATKGTETEKTAAGVAALRKALDDAINAPGDWAEVVKDSASAQQDASAMMDGAWEKFKAAVSERAIPGIMKLVPVIGMLTEHMDPIIVIFDALVESAQLVVDVFKALGYLKEKELTPQQKLEKATKELAAFDAGSKGVLTAPQMAKRNALQEVVDAADAAAYNRPKVDKSGKQSWTMESYVARQMELTHEDTDTGKAQVAARAKRDFDIISGGSTMEQNNAMRSMQGETNEQQTARGDLQAQFSAGGGNEVTSAQLEAAKAQMEAAKASMEAAQALKTAAPKLAAAPSTFNGR